eukprot:m.74857 g.74857  ORF g.74857 m.74857 type:complete len:67 (+) comp10349_c0_seq1:905-1105(+)
MEYNLTSGQHRDTNDIGIEARVDKQHCQTCAYWTTGWFIASAKDYFASARRLLTSPQFTMSQMADR